MSCLGEMLVDAVIRREGRGSGSKIDTLNENELVLILDLDAVPFDEDFASYTRVLSRLGVGWVNTGFLVEPKPEGP